MGNVNVSDCCLEKDEQAHHPGEVQYLLPPAQQASISRPSRWSISGLAQSEPPQVEHRAFGSLWGFPGSGQECEHGAGGSCACCSPGGGGCRRGGFFSTSSFPAPKQGPSVGFLASQWQDNASPSSYSAGLAREDSDWLGNSRPAMTWASELRQSLGDRQRDTQASALWLDSLMSRNGSRDSKGSGTGNASSSPRFWDS